MEAGILEMLAGKWVDALGRRDIDSKQYKIGMGLEFKQNRLWDDQMMGFALG